MSTSDSGAPSGASSDRFSGGSGAMPTQVPPPDAHRPEGEALSAFFDAEADELERRRVAARLLDDDELRGRWRRHHLMRAVIEGAPSIDVADVGLARLRAALADEPPLERLQPFELEQEATPVPAGRDGAVGPAERRRRWYAAGLGLATAAGLVGALWFGGLTPRSAQPRAIADVSPVAAGEDAFAQPGVAAPVAYPVPGAASGPGDTGLGAPLDPQYDAQRRAHLYMLMHARQSGLSQDVQGVALVKYVSYEPQ